MSVISFMVSKIINNKDEKYHSAKIDFCFLIFIGTPSNCSVIFIHFLPFAAGMSLARVAITQKKRTWYKAPINQHFIKNMK